MIAFKAPYDSAFTKGQETHFTGENEIHAMRQEIRARAADCTMRRGLSGTDGCQVTAALKLCVVGAGPDMASGLVTINFLFLPQSLLCAV